MGGIQTIEVRLEPAHAGWRLDRALADAVPTLSRERLKSLIRSGAVESGGALLRDPAVKVRGNESLRVAVPEGVSLRPGEIVTLDFKVGAAGR